MAGKRWTECTGRIRTELCARWPNPIQCNAVGSWSVTAPARTQCNFVLSLPRMCSGFSSDGLGPSPVWNPGVQSRRATPACDLSGACFLLHARLGSMEHEGGGTLRSIISWQRSGIVVQMQSMGGFQWPPRPVGIHQIGVSACLRTPRINHDPSGSLPLQCTPNRRRGARLWVSS